MGDIDYVSIILSTLGGLGLFIYGMHIMAEGLQKAAGTKMKKFLEVITSKKSLGVLVGALITAMIQSSSGTTVMVVGFVNAGLLTLQQAVSVIMGANIGTTITSWLVSSSDWLGVFSPTTLAPLAVCIGAFMLMLVKKKSISQVGEIIAGFGMLFVGITMMSEGVSPLRELQAFKDMFLTLGSNPILGLLIGAFVTGLIQSSAASVGILQTLAVAGLVPWSAAVYIIMGQNIGTCVTAMLSSIGASKNAKRAAYIHLLFNVVGSVIFSIVAVIFFMANKKFANTLITSTQISMVHTVFNIATTLLLYPFSNLLIKLSEILVQAGKDKDVEDRASLAYLDERLLGTPNMAVQSINKEVTRMGKIVEENFALAVEALLNKDSKKIELVSKGEEDIDMLDKSITEFLVKVCNTAINEEENEIVTTHFHTVNDFERIGDHSVNIAEIAQYMIEEDISFSEEGTVEIKEMIKLCQQSYSMAVKAKENCDVEFAKKAINLEEEVDNLEEKLRKGHIQRLTNNQCNTKAGVAFLDMLTNLERISDHAKNVAQAVIDVKEHKITKEVTGIKHY